MCFICFVIFAGVLAPFLAGPLADSIGRRRVLLSSAIFFMSAFGLTLMAKQVWHILLARFIQGLGISFVLTVLSLYASEIATPETRGAMSSFAQTLIVGKYKISKFHKYLILSTKQKTTKKNVFI